MRISFSFSLSITRGNDAVLEKGFVTRDSWKRLRKVVQRRDGSICQICGKYNSDGHVDHIIPLTKGGTDSVYNLQWLCPGCNMSKGNRILRRPQIAAIKTEDVAPVAMVELPGKVELYDDEAVEFLEGILKEGLPISQRLWSRKATPGALFTDREFKALCAELVKEGYARRGGVRQIIITRSGDTYFTNLLEGLQAVMSNKGRVK